MSWWHYILLVNVYLTLFFCFYTFLLRRETFFNLNRIYLVAATLLSFVLPVMNASWVKTLFITQQVQQTIKYLSPTTVYSGITPAHTAYHISFTQAIIFIYLAGVVFFTCRFIYQLIILNIMMANRNNGCSYSFFNNIRVKDCNEEYNLIVAHEEAHARQWHSADILLMEITMIVNWINPVVYLYRRAIKHIHEFIADRNVVYGGTSKADYAMLLLSQTFSASPHQLTNSFYNHSLLKQRIQMLQRNKSQRIKLLKYGFSAPLFILMLILSSATVDTSKALQAVNDKASETFGAHVAPDMTDATGSFTSHNSTINDLSDQDRADLYRVIKQHQPQNIAHLSAKTLNKGISDETQAFTAVEQNAEFPGGIKEFYKYLAQDIKYPKQARQEKIEGTVFVTYIVEKDGSVSNIKILRSIGGGIDEEAIRVLSVMPKWKPGMQNGHVVRQQYTVPITFKLVDDAIPAEAGTQTQASVN